MISDAQLLSAMSRCPGGDGVQAAWAEFYERHQSYLHTVVARAYGSFLGYEGVNDLVMDTFMRAQAWAGNETDAATVLSRFEANTLEDTCRRVRGWLGVISERLFMDRFREHATRATRHDAYVEDWRRGHDDTTEPEPTASAGSAIARVLDALDQIDQAVLRLSLPWYDIPTRSFNLPRGEAARLAMLVDLTPTAFRQRRHRALRKLEHLLASQEAPITAKDGIA